MGPGGAGDCRHGRRNDRRRCAAGGARLPRRAGKAKAKAPEPCERACLEDFVNQYLDGLVAHSAFSLPLASRVRFSENNQLLELGDGLWNVTTGVGPGDIMWIQNEDGSRRDMGAAATRPFYVAELFRIALPHRSSPSRDKHPQGRSADGEPALRAEEPVRAAAIGDQTAAPPPLPCSFACNGKRSTSRTHWARAVNSVSPQPQAV